MAAIAGRIFSVPPTVCCLPPKSETRNPKSETNPKFKCQKPRTAPNRAVSGFSPFPPFEFVSYLGFRVSEFRPAQAGGTGKMRLRSPGADFAYHHAKTHPISATGPGRLISSRREYIHARHCDTHIDAAPKPRLGREGEPNAHPPIPIVPPNPKLREPKSDPPRARW